MFERLLSVLASAIYMVIYPVEARVPSLSIIKPMTPIVPLRSAYWSGRTPGFL